MERTKERGSEGESGLTRELGLLTALLVVVANMVGTGVFTTSGLLLPDIGSAPIVLVAWFLGGLFALFGALSYGELAATLPTNGGEYRFLTHIYHPAVGFVAGFISLVVGFSAPIAASSLAFGEYLHALVPSLPPKASAAALVLVASVAHALHVRTGSGFQNVFTLVKVALIVVFIGGGLWVGADLGAVFDLGAADGSALLSPELAVGLVLVAFSYSGWNAAAYVAGEVKRPSRNLPLALGLGTLIVTVLYLGLNAVILAGAPASALSGEVEIGHVAAEHLFGARAGGLLSGLIALALVSSVSAMVMVGPRVYEAMGEDWSVLKFLVRSRSKRGPVPSIALQATLALVMLFTSSFGALLTYIGFTLSISAALTVAGLFVLRRHEPDRARPYKAWGYPVTPALFVLFAAWMVIHSVAQRPLESLVGLGTIVLGLALYAVVRRLEPEHSE